MKYVIVLITLLAVAFGQPVEVTVIPALADTSTANNSFANRSLHQVQYLTVADYLAGSTRWTQRTYLMFRIPEGDFDEVAVLTLQVQANDNASGEAVITTAIAEPFTESEVTHLNPPTVLDTQSFFDVAGVQPGQMLQVEVPIPDEPGLYAIALLPSDGLRRIDFVSTQGGAPPTLELRPADTTPPPDENDQAEISFPAQRIINQIAQQNGTFWFADAAIELRMIDGESVVTIRASPATVTAIIAWLRLNQ
jgi:hypothetical protein